MKDKKECKLNKEELDGVTGGYAITGHEGEWIVVGYTQDGSFYSEIFTTWEEAIDAAKKNQLKKDRSDGTFMYIDSDYDDDGIVFRSGKHNDALIIF